MKFSIALLATAVSAATFPRAPLMGRSAASVSVMGVDDMAVLLSTLTQPSVQACNGSPVALSDACHATFQCSEAAVADEAVFNKAQGQLVSAIGSIQQ